MLSEQQRRNKKNKSSATVPARQSADQRGVARADDWPGQHGEGRVLEALVQQRLRHSGRLAMQQGSNGLGGQVPQTEASAPGGEQQVHALTVVWVAPLSHHAADRVLIREKRVES